MKSIFYKALQLYTFLRLVSLDIVFGVVCGSYFASRIFEITPSIYFWITLVSAVWVIYTADHLLDGIRTKKKFVFETYRFHFDNRIVLMSIGIVTVLISSIFVLFFLEKELIIYGVSTFVLVIIYLFLNNIFRKRRRFFPKELIISALYTWGIFGGVLILKGNVTFFQVLVIANYFLLVSVNVLLFSYFDSEEDKVSHFNTLTVNFGKKLTRRSIFFILAIAFLISLFIVFWYSKWVIFWILVLMNLTLLLTILFPSFFKNCGYYGIVADAVFFFPAVLFWVDSF
ncbi:MAG: UbiA family prenyltransferase [Bacteroidetes bacterium]|nr:UbiA family prenyltransferase [Bacteroidota bacterium]